MLATCGSTYRPGAYAVVERWHAARASGICRKALKASSTVVQWPREAADAQSSGDGMAETGGMVKRFWKRKSNTRRGSPVGAPVSSCFGTISTETTQPCGATSRRPRFSLTMARPAARHRSALAPLERRGFGWREKSTSGRRCTSMGGHAEMGGNVCPSRSGSPVWKMPVSACSLRSSSRSHRSAAGDASPSQGSTKISSVHPAGPRTAYGASTTAGSPSPAGGT